MDAAVIYTEKKICVILVKNINNPVWNDSFLQLGFNKSCFWNNKEVLSHEIYRIFFIVQWTLIYQEIKGNLISQLMTALKYNCVLFKKKIVDLSRLTLYAESYMQNLTMYFNPFFFFLIVTISKVCPKTYVWICEYVLCKRPLKNCAWWTWP